MLTFQFALDEKDCAAYFEATMLENLKNRKSSNQSTFLVLGGVLLVLFFLDYNSNDFPSTTFITFSLLILLLLFLRLPQKNRLNAVYKTTLKKQVEIFVANSDNVAFFEPKTYYVGDEGIEVLSTTGESTLYWRAFVKRKDTPTHIFLFNGQASGLVFPKEKIASLAEFEAMLGRHISFHAEVGRHIK